MLASTAITISVGNQSISFSLLYVAVAAIVGIIAEIIVGWRIPFGIIGAIIAGLIGIWLITTVINIQGVGDIYLWEDVPLIRSVIGAAVFIALWHIITGAFVRRRG